MASSSPPSAPARLTYKASAVGPQLSSHNNKVLSPTMGTAKVTNGTIRPLPLVRGTVRKRTAPAPARLRTSVCEHAPAHRCRRTLASLRVCARAPEQRICARAPAHRVCARAPAHYVCAGARAETRCVGARRLTGFIDAIHRRSFADARVQTSVRRRAGADARSLSRGRICPCAGVRPRTRCADARPQARVRRRSPLAHRVAHER